MPNSRIVDVAEVIDTQRLGPLHWRVMILSFALVLIDSYDILAVAYVAPLLQQQWKFPASALGPLFASAVVGSALGPVLFGYFADQFGRRPVVLFGALWFGAFTIATAWAESLNQLMLLRLLAGLGMGAILAIVSAHVAEYAPRRIRATVVILVFMGFLLGGGLGALVASRVLAAHSWHAIFWIGGAIPLAIAFIGFFAFPESLRWLTLRPHRTAELIRLLKQLSPASQFVPDTRFVLADEVNADRSSFKALFAGRLSAITPLLWLCNILSLFAFYFVVQWTPVLLTSAGMSIQRATLATAAFQICGFIAAISLMRSIDRHAFLLVPILFVCSVPIIASIGIHGLSDLAVIALTGAAGFCIAGNQMSLVATQSQVYPTSIRAWGVGFCFGAGRLGAILGSSAAGLLLGLGLPISRLFYLSGVVMIMGVIGGFVLVRLYRRQLSDLRARATSNDRAVGDIRAAAIADDRPPLTVSS